MSDQFTGSIGYLLNRLTGCLSIATSKLYGGDPNIDNPCIYKDRIAQICRKETPRFIIDIHGAASEREFDVHLSSNSGKTFLGKKKILETLNHNFQSFGFSRISHDRCADLGSNTITAFVAFELGIPAVQIEINRQYRVPAQNPQGFHRLIGALAESVKELGQ